MKIAQYDPCGIYCGACRATDCGGCRSELIDDWVKGCPFRRCTREKNLESCCFCDDFPCQALDEFMNDKWPHHWTMESNLKFIKQNGIEKWLVAQQKKWSCKKCGTEIHWYRKSCSCGQRLEAWNYRYKN